ncbi:MAG: hypothetical protein LC104_15085 [Bacteroidales bacterium]|nr:hypothetical protein [Bacteroidales bacterium]
MTERTARLSEAGMLLLAFLITILGALPFAGGWNDGSRLAAVESLAERGTLCIDASAFVLVPAPAAVYDPASPNLALFGTRDKLFIQGHYYSDKSPVPTVLLAGVYKVWLMLGGPTIVENPGTVIAFLTVMSAGWPLLLAAWCLSRMGQRLGLSPATRLLFLGCFLLATVALPYTRHINNGIMLLGVAMPLCVLLADLGTSPPGHGDQWDRWDQWGRPVLIGLLAGLGYAIDLGVGPPLLVAVVGYAAYQMRSVLRMGALFVGMLPFMGLHHVLNYAVGGTILPANAVLEYLQFPGSPFTERIATGGLKHDPWGLVVYGLDLLVGKKGFLTHNWPLFLATLGALRVGWNYPQHRAALGFCLTWAGLTWMAYAATSTNLSGLCCSVRWFVPLIAPGFWALAIVLKEYPRFRPDLIWLTAVGTGMTALMWQGGPWMPKLVWGWWGWAAVGGIGWGIIRYRDEGKYFMPPRGWVWRWLRVRTRSSSGV